MSVMCVNADEVVLHCALMRQNYNVISTFFRPMDQYPAYGGGFSSQYEILRFYGSTLPK